MMRKMASTLGFASLFILGAPATGYSDSLPAFTGHTYYEGYDSCFSPIAPYAPGGIGIVNNNCDTVDYVIPIQSRATGYWTFNATGYGGFPCWIIGKDYYSGSTVVSGYVGSLSGRNSLGRLYVPSNAVLYYYCTVPTGGQLMSVDWTQ